MGTEEQEVRLMGTEEQVKTAKRLIEDFVSQQTSGLSWLLLFLCSTFLLNSMHSKIVNLSFVNRLFVRPSVSL